MRLRLAALVAAAAFATSTLAAHADTYHVSFTGTDVDTFSYDIASSPSPVSFDSESWTVVNTVLLNGVSEDNIGIVYTNFGVLDVAAEFYLGPDILYTSSESMPTLKLGDFSLSEFGRGTGTLAVTDLTPPPSSIPEPSSIALFGTGILGLVGAARRKFLHP